MTKVAVVQASAIPFDAQKTIAKMATLLQEISQQGAKFAVFPEAFIGGYPKGSNFGAVVGARNDNGRRLYEKYVSGAVALDGPELQELAEIVTANDVYTVVGIIEKYGRTLYCTAVTFAPHQGIINYHRKLMPTGLERLVWGFGDGSTIEAVDTPYGKVGSVICWENYMPALRQAMYAQGVELYCVPTADDRKVWTSSMQHIALEGRVFVLSSCQATQLQEYPEDFQKEFILENYQQEDYVMHGGSCIVNPYGEVIAGPVYDKETILYADLDYAQLAQTNFDFDPVGHYSRPDIFTLQVDTSKKDPVVFNDNSVKTGGNTHE